jgi:large subunit ribosomal protein L32
MGAVPKSRIGPTRRRKRRTHLKLKPVKLVRCENCQEYQRPHHLCEACGTFRGMQVIEVDEFE